MKCEQAEEAAKMAVADAELAKSKARDYLPNSRHPGKVDIKYLTIAE